MIKVTFIEKKKWNGRFTFTTLIIKIIKYEPKDGKEDRFL